MSKATTMDTANVAAPRIQAGHGRGLIAAVSLAGIVVLAAAAATAIVVGSGTATTAVPKAAPLAPSVSTNRAIPHGAAPIPVDAQPVPVVVPAPARPATPGARSIPHGAMPIVESIPVSPTRPIPHGAAPVDASSLETLALPPHGAP